MKTFLVKIGEELCSTVWEKTERGADDRFKADDLPMIFAAACAAAIRRSPDARKAERGVAEVFGSMLRADADGKPPPFGNLNVSDGKGRKL